MINWEYRNTDTQRTGTRQFVDGSEVAIELQTKLMQWFETELGIEAGELGIDDNLFDHGVNSMTIMAFVGFEYRYKCSIIIIDQYVYSKTPSRITPTFTNPLHPYRN